MSQYTTSPMAQPEGGSLKGYASSESESKQPTSSSGKKRASRAGTRSVTTLSAAQLERKRANDREAQRAIRQRTKDHIEGLERRINDLSITHDARERLITATQQRNRELEEENAYLRERLSSTGDPFMLHVSGSDGECTPFRNLHRRVHAKWYRYRQACRRGRFVRSTYAIATATHQRL